MFFYVSKHTNKPYNLQRQKRRRQCSGYNPEQILHGVRMNRGRGREDLRSAKDSRKGTARYGMREEHWPALIVASEEAILDRAHQDRNLVMPQDRCDECTTANIIALLCPLFRLVSHTNSDPQYIQLRVTHQFFARKHTGDICSSESGVRLASYKHSNYYSLRLGLPLLG